MGPVHGSDIISLYDSSLHLDTSLTTGEIYINNWLHDSVRKLVSLSHIPFVIVIVIVIVILC